MKNSLCQKYSHKCFFHPRRYSDFRCHFQKLGRPLKTWANFCYSIIHIKRMDNLGLSHTSWHFFPYVFLNALSKHGTTSTPPWVFSADLPGIIENESLRTISRGYIILAFAWGVQTGSSLLSLSHCTRPNVHIWPHTCFCLLSFIITKADAAI